MRLRQKVTCDNCGHDNELLDLVQAADYVGQHPESLRRHVRYEDVVVTKFERGLYFKEKDLQDFLALEDAMVEAESSQT
jgi:hypothetical protein|tara:strand:+ start:338 stop:574 length:237 start_codon:yes stop_codon:yes gene_type:complete